ncbi:hypothetical protein [Microbacterium sp. 2RAF4]|uniref:hypothetical protein n=1 Tax=Microbacterium sp. 2RAF4 TaxID=3232999 RepID=UPI003F9A2733
MTDAPTATRAASLVEKTVLGVIAGAAGAIAVVDLIGAGVRTAVLMTSPSVTVPSMPLSTVEAPAVLAASSNISEAQYDTVTLTATGLSLSPRLLLAIADALAILGPFVLCVAVAWLCIRLLIGRPFGSAATWGIAVAALAVMAGGLMSQAVRANAFSEIALELDLVSAGVPAFEMSIDLAPFGWGFALVVVAGAFEIGQRLQRDTEGLV